MVDLLMNWLLGVRRSEIKDKLCLSLLNWWSGSSLHWNEDLERKGTNQELYFRHVKFEMPIRHLGGQAIRQNAGEETGVEV